MLHASPVRYARSILVLALLSTSCGGLTQALRALRPVQEEVVRLVNSPHVTVNLANGRYLIIGIANSPIRDLSPDEKHRKALEIATAGYATYALRSTLQQVNVVFPTVRRSFLFLWVNRVGNDDAF